MVQVTINGQKWQSVGPDWQVSEGGEVLLPWTPTNYGLLFSTGPSMADVTVHCRFQMRYEGNGAGSGGIIVRAQDSEHYYWVHVDWCGQSLRGRNFWASISRVDESGYIRLLKSEIVRGMQAVTGVPIDFRAECRGNRIACWLDGRRGPEVDDNTYPAAGRVGLASMGVSHFEHIHVEGGEAPTTPFACAESPPVNWFLPAPQYELGKWQHVGGLCRTPGGDLLLIIDASPEVHDYSSATVRGICRSTDNGHTWSPLERTDLKGALHTGSDARLYLYEWDTQGEGSYRRLSLDDGRTWSEREPISVRINPLLYPKDHSYRILADPVGTAKKGNMGPSRPIVTLADGTLVQLLQGGVSLLGWPDELAGASIAAWGAGHCRVFCVRSTDGGATWSEPVALDAAVKAQGQVVQSNMDMIEPACTQLPDGELLVLTRTIYSPTMWETRSRDGGQTWSLAVPSPIPGYGGPALVCTKSGYLALVKRHPDTCLSISTDGGRNWQSAIIDPSAWFNGAMLEVEPDVILVVYMDPSTDVVGPVRGQRIRLTPDGPIPNSEA